MHLIYQFKTCTNILWDYLREKSISFPTFPARREIAMSKKTSLPAPCYPPSFWACHPRSLSLLLILFSSFFIFALIHSIFPLLFKPDRRRYGRRSGGHMPWRINAVTPSLPRRRVSSKGKWRLRFFPPHSINVKRRSGGQLSDVWSWKFTAWIIYVKQIAVNAMRRKMFFGEWVYFGIPLLWQCFRLNRHNGAPLLLYCEDYEGLKAR